MPPSVDLHGDTYELSEPITVGETRWRLLTTPIINRTFARYLAESGHREPETGPALVNTVNYDGSLRWTGGAWQIRPGRDHLPVVLVTHRAAQRFADDHALSLLTTELWDVAVDVVRPEVDPTACNIEERHGGPIEVDAFPTDPLGTRSLVGNVAFWGCPADEHMSWCFGIGWNKSRINMEGTMAKRRWARISSVSTGLRYAVPERARVGA